MPALTEQQEDQILLHCNRFQDGDIIIIAKVFSEQFGFLVTPDQVATLIVDQEVGIKDRPNSSVTS